MFHDKRHPRELGPEAITAFLNHLAVDGLVAAATQTQALNAIVSLYERVLERDVPELDQLVRARRPKRLPVVLTPGEVRQLLAHLDGTPRLVASLPYGSGLRLLEALSLRVKDLDFAAREIRLRDGTGRRELRSQLATSRFVDPAKGRERRHDFHETGRSAPCRNCSATRAFGRR